mgnify:CR=1 FL=1
MITGLITLQSGMTHDQRPKASAAGVSNSDKERITRRLQDGLEATGARRRFQFAKCCGTVAAPAARLKEMRK